MQRVLALIAVAMLLASAVPVGGAAADDSTDLRAVEVVTTGVTGAGVALNGNTNRVYVPGHTSPDNRRVLAVLDGATHQVSTVATGVDPAESRRGPHGGGQPVAVHAGLDRIYIAGFKETTNERVVAVVDGRANVVALVPTFVDPAAAAVNERLDRVYIAGFDDLGMSRSVLAVMDAVSHVISRVPLPVDDPVAIAVDTATNRIYIAGDRGELAVVEPVLVSGAVVDHRVSTIRLLPIDPVAVAVNSATNRVFIAGHRTVAIVDGDMHDITVVETGVDPLSLAVDGVLDRVYMTAFTYPDNRRVVAVLDGATGNVLGLFPLDIDPASGIAVNPATGRLYVPGFAHDGARVVQVLQRLHPTVTTLSSSPNPSPAGSEVTLTATVTTTMTTAQHTPTGVVAFFSAGGLLGEATVGPDGSARWTTRPLSVGTHTFTASYAGDAEFADSSSAPHDHVVQHRAGS